MQEIALVAALGHYNVIGKGGSIPWNCRDDLKFFQKLTKGHIVIMGRKTWDSLPVKPLKNRDNIVVSNEPRFLLECSEDAIHMRNEESSIYHHYNDTMRTTCVKSYDLAQELANRLAAAESKKIFVIGGASAYNYFLPHASELYLTFVDYNGGGDVYFPEYNHRYWYVQDLEAGYPDDRNSHSFITSRLYKKLHKEPDDQDPRN